MRGLLLSQKRAQAALTELRRANHPDCILCASTDRFGLRLKFNMGDDGTVVAHVNCGEIYQGYSGLLHGGIMSLLLDGAMTNCLFAAGKIALTAEMTIRYCKPAAADMPVQLKARIRRSRPPLHLVEAELLQSGEIIARAIGKFMDRPEPAA